MLRPFSTLQKLYWVKPKRQLPDHDSSIELAQRFNNFFINKVKNIRENITPSILEITRWRCGRQSHSIWYTKCTKRTAHIPIKKIILKSRTKLCELDPIPTWLLKQCQDSLIPLITRIINTSLSESKVPQKLKNYLIRPLLKKNNLDRQILKNNRPVYQTYLFYPKYWKRTSQYSLTNIPVSINWRIHFSLHTGRIIRQKRPFSKYKVIFYLHWIREKQQV